MTLCFDFGNTRYKYGTFVDGRLTEKGVLQNKSADDVRSLLEKYHPEQTVLSSVVHHDIGIEEVLSQNSDFLKVTGLLKLPFIIPIPHPEAMGADRLALAAYVCRNFPNQNNLIIAIGSAITYNFINKYNYFLGGGISPGMEMRFQSMHDLTALLPRIERNWNFPLIGYDTRTNILSGVMMGMSREISGMIEAYSDKFVNFNVHLTGGDTANFARHIKYRIFANPDIVLEGIYAISEYNNG